MYLHINAMEGIIYAAGGSIHLAQEEEKHQLGSLITTRREIFRYNVASAVSLFLPRSIMLSSLYISIIIIMIQVF